MTNRPSRDLAKTREVATAIALEAGHLTLSAYRRGHQIDHKRTDVDLVTETDLASEQLIKKRLIQHFPEDGLLAEEGSAIEANAGSEALWIVDPLDGTTNFAHGHPFYCVSIALQLAGRLVVGVIHAPVLGLTWSAHRGGGARRNSSSASVSLAESLKDSLCATGFPYDRQRSDDDNTRELRQVMKRAQGIRRCGSAAIDLAFIADGTFDGFWEKRLAPWDIAAGVVIVEEAGGRATGLDGSTIPPWPPTIVATNGRIHDELTDVVLATG
jgi:myo-inositol-1(or 4)-monophosphatase